MVRNSKILLSLPSRDEIQSTKESVVKGKPNLIRKVIRYKNGLKITLIQSFEENIFSLRINSQRVAFRMVGDSMLSVFNLGAQ